MLYQPCLPPHSDRIPTRHLRYNPRGAKRPTTLQQNTNNQRRIWPGNIPMEREWIPRRAGIGSSRLACDPKRWGYELPNISRAFRARSGIHCAILQQIITLSTKRYQSEFFYRACSYKKSYVYPDESRGDTCGRGDMWKGVWRFVFCRSSERLQNSGFCKNLFWTSWVTSSSGTEATL